MPSHASGIAKQLLSGMPGMKTGDICVVVLIWLRKGGRSKDTLDEVITLLSAEKEGSARNSAASMLQSAINGTPLGHNDVLELMQAAWVQVSAEDEWVILD